MNAEIREKADMLDAIDRAVAVIEKNSSLGCKCRGVHMGTCGFRKLDDEVPGLGELEDWETRDHWAVRVSKPSGELIAFDTGESSLSPAEILEIRDEEEYLRQFEEYEKQLFASDQSASLEQAG